jgi:hypothetical protein
MTVVTISGTIYQLSQADANGIRTITSDKYGTRSRTLLSLRKGKRLRFHVTEIRQNLKTSTVVSIEPDPDAT